MPFESYKGASPKRGMHVYNINNCTPLKAAPSADFGTPAVRVWTTRLFSQDAPVHATGTSRSSHALLPSVRRISSGFAIMLASSSHAYVACHPIIDHLRARADSHSRLSPGSYNASWLTSPASRSLTSAHPSCFFVFLENQPRTSDHLDLCSNVSPTVKILWKPLRLCEESSSSAQHQKVCQNEYAAVSRQSGVADLPDLHSPRRPLRRASCHGREP